MTREAIEYFKFHRKIFCDDHLKICPKDSIAYQATLKEKEFYDMAIKALEQEPVLDKIRAEIEPKCDRINSLASVLPYTAHREIQELLCEIIDLCKVESEG